MASTPPPYAVSCHLKTSSNYLGTYSSKQSIIPHSHNHDFIVVTLSLSSHRHFTAVSVELAILHQVEEDVEDVKIMEMHEEMHEKMLQITLQMMHMCTGALLTTVRIICRTLQAVANYIEYDDGWY